MAWAELNSSHAAAFDYNPETLILSVRFNDGSEWDYRGVAPHVAEALAVSPSAGRFLNQQVKPFHHAVRRR